MSMYFQGFQQAKDYVSKMNEAELLHYIDGLFGRENLSENFTFEELRSEALSQCKKEFTDTRSEEYERVKFYIGLVNAQRKAKYLR